ncbi:MAG: hypothetical protein U1D25_11845 [Hydrogenophaga sp.]|uniref:hypothetical protein n=1 Tax=Hydrogenophaga sp. TaxID=1904254 RepID=UPI002ABC5B1B|nr:hypothetical protein [Hydrogenophaga sp.]MDZ4188785.1 hypothetical protein [Hydrogenophaga sp.]
MTITLPPSLPVEDLLFSAKLDFVKLTNCGIKITLPVLSGSHEWTRPTRNKPDWEVTIHDPTAADLRKIIEAYENPTIMAVEVAVDLVPKIILDGAAHASHLGSLYVAVAARFRPEDKALWDYGQRGAVDAPRMKPQPLERRFARPDEEVLYGHRGGFMQSKLYLKTLDRGTMLSLEKQRVRMEVTLRRWACVQFGLDKASDLFGYPYRAKFTTNFRIVDRPEVRAVRGLSDRDFIKRTTRMLRAWKTAGVGKFAVGDAPREDVLDHEVAKIKSRARAQLPADQYRLVRDQRANAKIGAALTGLQRRMQTP